MNRSQSGAGWRRDGTPAELLPVVVLADGARWTWEHMAALFGDERTDVVDWSHATRHIPTAAEVGHGDDAPETQAWARAALDHLWHTGVKAVVEWFDAARPGPHADAA
jgi:hypothetical protein